MTLSLEIVGKQNLYFTAEFEKEIKQSTKAVDKEVNCSFKIFFESLLSKSL